MTSERPRCPYCGKLAPKRTTTVFNPGKTDAEKTAWLYQSNQQVVSIRYSYRWDEARGRYNEKPEYVWKVTVWDGESYAFGSSHPFCNIDHAWRFAMAAYHAGYRMKSLKEVNSEPRTT